MRTAIVPCALALALLTVTLPSAPAADPRAEVELLPSEARAGALFGRGADLDGETAVVSGYDNTGPAVFVYERGDGDWLETQKLTSDDVGSYFGFEVAIHGDTLVATAPTETIDDEQTGAAYVFVRSGGTWTRQAKLEPDEPVAGTRFGHSVDVRDDTIVIGDNAFDTTVENQGAVYVFTRSGTTWTQQARLHNGDPQRNDTLGSAVAIYGDTLLAGASAQFGGKGAVYVFRRSGTSWSQYAKHLDFLGGSFEDQYGLTVAMSEEYAVLAAPYHSGNVTAAGQLYLFDRGGGPFLSASGTLTAPTPRANEHFGIALAMTDERLVVGASGYDAEGVNTGRAYVYTRGPGVWVLDETIDAPDAAEWDLFGDEVGVTEEVILVSAPFNDAPEADSGNAWIFDDTPSVATSSIVPSQVTVILPAPAKRAKSPGLWAKGTLDTGPDPVDLTLPGTLRVGTAEYDIPTMTLGKDDRTYTHDDGVVDLKMRTAKGGGSKAVFTLHVDADLTGHVDPDAEVTISFGNADVEAAVTVQLSGGKFKLGSSPSALGETALHCVKSKAKLKGERRDTFKLLMRFGGDGSVPPDAPEILVGFGDVFEEVLDASAFKLKKSKWTYKNPKAEGVTKATFDFGKGVAKITAKKCDLGAFAQGPVPLTLTLEIDGDRRGVAVRGTVKGKTLKY